MFGQLPLALRRLPGDEEALAWARGRNPDVERANDLALLLLAAGCLLALLFVALTGGAPPEPGKRVLGPPAAEEPAED